MKYKLRKNFTTDPNIALQEILTDRGVTDLENFMHPSKHCELDPYNLQNVVEGAQMLLSHLRKGNKLLFDASERIRHSVGQQVGVHQIRLDNVVGVP